MNKINCPNCGSIEIGDLDCDVCGGQGFDDVDNMDEPLECSECDGQGYIEHWRECLECGETWEAD